MQRKIRASVFTSPAFASLAFASIFASAIALGCSAAPEDSTPLGGGPPTLGGSGGASPAPGGAVAGGGAAAGGSAGALNPLGRERCRAPVGVSGSPKNTQDAVTLLNALPKPTSVACFLESLDRPLTIYATSSIFSAQPALSVVSPRVFVKLGRLWLSIVIDGESSYLMEFGDDVSSELQARSIKGELALPISEPVAASAPYDRILYGEGTVCGLCHFDEVRVEDSPLINAFSSIAFRPRPDTRVSVDALRSAFATCDWRAQPHRCEMLSAVFDGGAVMEEPFPDAMSTFF